MNIEVLNFVERGCLQVLAHNAKIAWVWRRKNPEKVKAIRRKYFSNPENLERQREHSRRYQKRRWRSDAKFRKRHVDSQRLARHRTKPKLSVQYELQKCGLGAAGIARAWGVSRQFVHELKLKGCPVDSLPAANEWRMKHARKPAGIDA